MKMATVEAACPCGGSFKAEGNAVHCGLELSRFLKAHDECPKDKSDHQWNGLGIPPHMRMLEDD